MARFKLLVTEVNQPETIQGKNGPFQKLSFKATNADRTGDALTYQAFSKALFPSIVSGKQIDADIETTSREHNGATYTDRKVTQIYQDGQPIGGQRQGGFQSRPDNSASIEMQVAAKISAELIVAGKCPESLHDALIKWCLQRLGAETEPKSDPEWDKLGGMFKSASPEIKKRFTDGLAKAVAEHK